MTAQDDQRREAQEWQKHEQIVGAIHAIAHGTVDGPGGLEGLAMAIGSQGVGGGTGLAEAVKDGMREIAEANERGLNEVANAIRSLVTAQGEETIDE